MKHFGQRFLYLYEPVPMGEFITVKLVQAWFPKEPVLTMNGDTITDIPLGYVPPTNLRFYSDKTRRHMGTSIYVNGDIENWEKRDVDCTYHDIGTPEKLKIAREYHAKH